MLKWAYPPLSQKENYVDCNNNLQQLTISSKVIFLKGIPVLVWL